MTTWIKSVKSGSVASFFGAYSEPFGGPEWEAVDKESATETTGGDLVAVMTRGLQSLEPSRSKDEILIEMANRGWLAGTLSGQGLDDVWIPVEKDTSLSWSSVDKDEID